MQIPNLRPKKRSLTLRGHRTSVSLEDPFWRAFTAIAAERGIPINQLAAQIDETRDYEVGFASAIRYFILKHYQDRAASASDKSHPSPVP